MAARDAIRWSPLPIQPRKFDQRGRCLDLAFGQGEQLSGGEGEVPAPVADPFGSLDLGCEGGRGGEQGFERAGLLARSRSGKAQHALGAVGGDRLKLHAGRIDQHQAVGLFQYRVGRAFNDVDGEGVGQLDRNARVLDPRQGAQFLAQLGNIDIGHGLIALGERTGIDLLFIHPVGAGDAHVLDGEARIPGNRRNLRLRQRGHAGKAGDDEGDPHPATNDHGEPDAAPLFFGERKDAHDPVDYAAGRPARLANGDRAALRLGGAAHTRRAVTPDLLRHRGLPS